MKKTAKKNLEEEKRKYLEAVGNRLYQFRTEARKTQFEIAEMAGISGRAYSEIERGASDMRITTLASISTALGVSPDMILFEAPVAESALSLSAVVESINQSDERTRRLAAALLDTVLHNKK